MSPGPTLKDSFPNYPEFTFPRGNPWTQEDTAKNIAIVRPHFHMVSWEFVKAPLRVPLSDTNWEDPNLVSVIVVRDPLSRLLAADALTNRYFPGLKVDGSEQLWWSYANYSANTDNYAMRILAGDGCCSGEQTDRRHLATAKSLLHRFTFVLNIECLDEGLIGLSDILGIPLQKDKLNKTKKIHPPPADRIPYREVYEYLAKKNKLDTELYEWARTRALVNCSQIESNGERLSSAS